VVWAENPNPNPRLHNRLKDVDAKLDVPPLKPELRSFVDWVANYTLASRGMVLRMALRMGDLGPARERVGVRLTDVKPQRMTPARQRVMAALADGFVRSKGRRRHAADDGRSGRILRVAARRRHRLGQYGSLFHGDRREYPARPPDA